MKSKWTDEIGPSSQPRSEGRLPVRPWHLAVASILIAVISVLACTRRPLADTDDHRRRSNQGQFGRSQMHQPETRLLIPDPMDEGWSTEASSTQAGSQLKRLAKLLTDTRAVSTSSVGELISDEFSCTGLRPKELVTRFENGPLTARWARVDTLSFEGQTTGQYANAAGLARSLERLLEPFRNAENVRASFKVFHLEQTDSVHFTTRQFFSISGRTNAGMLQQNATWRAVWVDLDTDDLPKLEWIGLETFEEVASQQTGGPLFADCTAAVLGSNTSFWQQMNHGNVHWSRRLEKYLHVYPFGHHGLAVGDVNGDGLDDVYRCQPGGIPNRLYVQQRDGSAKDMSARAGVDFLDSTRSALIVDLDNDSDQDLVLVMFDAVVVLENDGGGKFTVRKTIDDVPHGYSLAAADYDLDADLDIYVCVYYTTGDVASDLPVPVPYYDANNGGRNFLLRNEADWQFTDVTDQLGLDANNHRFSYAATWEDYDNDGDADLYVANDFGRNNLFRNDHGRFVDVAAQAGLEDSAFGMSVSFGDYNRDGWFDNYVGNMFSAAGNRVTNQNRFRAGATRQIKSRYRRLARGNTLFANNGDGTFRDVSVEAGVTMGRWSWSSIFSDVNNDGWEDLLIANGFITGADTGDL